MKNQIHSQPSIRINSFARKLRPLDRFVNETSFYTNSKKLTHIIPVSVAAEQISMKFCIASVDEILSGDSVLSPVGRL
jgi:hypothetical protein